MCGTRSTRPRSRLSSASYKRGLDLSSATAEPITGISCRLRERASDIAYALFSFPSLADYERYRARFGVDPEFIDADRIRDKSGCVRRYERSFMRPLLPHR